MGRGAFFEGMARRFLLGRLYKGKARSFFRGKGRRLYKGRAMCFIGAEQGALFKLEK